MKTVRFVTFLIMAMLVFSVWTPSPVFAKADTAIVTIGASSVSSNGTLVAAKLVKVTVNNRTGGTIYITLTGQRSYSFAAPNQGKTSFQIEPGKYTYTIRTSACPGMITRKQSFKSGGSLGSWTCRG